MDLAGSDMSVDLQRWQPWHIAAGLRRDTQVAAVMCRLDEVAGF